jgi:hypothetical protein
VQPEFTRSKVAHKKSGGMLGVPNFFPKSFPNDVESTIWERMRKQRKENENFLKKKMLVTSFEKHFGNNLLECLALSKNQNAYMESNLEITTR